MYELLKGKGPEVLGIDEATVRKRICEKSGSHRSTVSRLYLAGYIDHSLGLPPGEVKEYVLRELRVKVRKESCGDVLEKALEKKGSYRQITAKVVVEVAEEFGCLRKPPVGEAGGKKGKCLPDDGQHSGVESSAEPSPIAGPPSPATQRLDRDKLETLAVDGAMNSPVPDRVQPLVEMVKGKKSDLSFAKRFLEIRFMKPELIRKLDSFSLEESQEALRLLDKIS